MLTAPALCYASNVWSKNTMRKENKEYESRFLSIGGWCLPETGYQDCCYSLKKTKIPQSIDSSNDSIPNFKKYKYEWEFHSKLCRATGYCCALALEKLGNMHCFANDTSVKQYETPLVNILI